jgi:ABC-type Fe2+-enterobactin transport system substrate-binding protein
VNAPECCRDGSPASSISENPFEELRGIFLARLRSDRALLTTLATALTRAEGDEAYNFEDIQLFAHRLRGGAAIFETPEIGTAAYALEQAAVSASVAHAESAHAAVRKALEHLLERLPS